jgi:hypothetical protein
MPDKIVDNMSDNIVTMMLTKAAARGRGAPACIITAGYSVTIFYLTWPLIPSRILSGKL